MFDCNLLRYIQARPQQSLNVTVFPRRPRVSQQVIVQSKLEIKKEPNKIKEFTIIGFRLVKYICNSYFPNTLKEAHVNSLIKESLQVGTFRLGAKLCLPTTVDWWDHLARKSCAFLQPSVHTFSGSLIF